MKAMAEKFLQAENEKRIKNGVLLETLAKALPW